MRAMTRIKCISPPPMRKANPPNHEITNISITISKSPILFSPPFNKLKFIKHSYLCITYRNCTDKISYKQSFHIQLFSDLTHTNEVKLNKCTLLKFIQCSRKKTDESRTLNID